jgi:hypothetical protein
MSENTQNEIVADIKDSTPVAEFVKVEEAKVEEVQVEEVKVEEAPVVVENVITESAPAVKQGLGPVGNGAMGVASFKKEEKKSTAKVEAKKEETVAIHSTRNVTWSGVGKVYIGYNIVSKAAADKWLTRNHTRIATPEEVAKEFNK